ncbi:hypothetical protein [Bradyrhizobium sp. BR 10289]|uniref:hypothetical protein n=1 Tax=Bradyrhizobium sp. BR 10289 TaxID=2749993 RepID=UPI001C64AA81|nr:hypothetical protein [Bradyrhizobium sp. BR 10289]MBW7970955.1 hypothetical protein [Bradyrhizobium sp. BR 10289]
MPAILSDAALTNDYPDAIDTDEGAINAFLADPTEGDDASPKKPSNNKGEDEVDDETPTDEETNDDEASEETPEDYDEEGSEEKGSEDDETDETKPKSKKFADDDETYVKIKVGDEEHEVKVTDLKRLWGQEAALTRKSQEVSTAKQTYDEGQAKNIAAYNVLLQRSTERADQYRALPWTQLMKDPNVPADQLAALQAEASKALEDEAFLKNEIDGFMKKVGDEQKAAQRTAAQECIKALTNPESPSHIKGWNEALYNDIRTFAVSEGLNQDMVNSLTDPGAFKILHMAMQFKRGASKVMTKKVNKTPTKIVKTSASSPVARGSSKTVAAKQAVAKAIKTGNGDDAINAFLALDSDD